MDAEARSRRPSRQRKELISRNFLKPSDGLEPSTPSFTTRFETKPSGITDAQRLRKPLLYPLSYGGFEAWLSRKLLASMYPL